MAVVTRFRVNRAGLDALFRSPRQPVALHMANVGRQLAGAMRREAPRSKGPGPHMADKINSHLIPTGRGGAAVVVSIGVPWAEYVIKGTRPHSIGSPVYIDGVGWRYIGLSPAGKGKIHPGTKPNNFPVRAAASLGLRLTIR